MDRTKLLTISVIGLLLLNLATISFLLIGPPKDHRRPEDKKPNEVIIDKLHFDAEQIKKFDAIIQIHKTKVETFEKDIRKNKNQLYVLLLDKEINIHKKDSLLQIISNDLNQIENLHFNHFIEIKNICREDQLKNYYDLTEDLSRIFSKEKPPRPRND